MEIEVEAESVPRKTTPVDEDCGDAGFGRWRKKSEEKWRTWPEGEAAFAQSECGVRC